MLILLIKNPKTTPSYSFLFHTIVVSFHFSFCSSLHHPHNLSMQSLVAPWAHAVCPAGPWSLRELSRRVGSIHNCRGKAAQSLEGWCTDYSVGCCVYPHTQEKPTSNTLRQEDSTNTGISKLLIEFRQVLVQWQSSRLIIWSNMSPFPRDSGNRWFWRILSYFQHFFKSQIC